MAFAAIPSMVPIVLCRLLPESPRFLSVTGRHEAALEVLLLLVLYHVEYTGVRWYLCKIPRIGHPLSSYVKDSRFDSASGIRLKVGFGLVDEN